MLRSDTDDEPDATDYIAKKIRSNYGCTTNYNNNKIKSGDDIRGIITPQRSPSVSNGNLKCQEGANNALRHVAQEQKLLILLVELPCQSIGEQMRCVALCHRNVLSEPCYWLDSLRYHFSCSFILRIVSPDCPSLLPLL
mmetsp:Transcript_1012/g.2230  ORF Transcript_1012/g.2230 Transcript_1012/m.2230 type:complete len:139 (-) Transcript_1012:1759-2175(-)